VWFKGDYRGVGFYFILIFRLLNNRYRQWVFNWNSSLSSGAMGDNNRVYIGSISSGNSSAVLLMIRGQFRVQLPVIIRDFMILQIINFSVPSARQKFNISQELIVPAC